MQDDTATDPTTVSDDPPDNIAADQPLSPDTLKEEPQDTISSSPSLNIDNTNSAPLSTKQSSIIEQPTLSVEPSPTMPYPSIDTNASPPASPSGGFFSGKTKTLMLLITTLLTVSGTFLGVLFVTQKINTQPTKSSAANKTVNTVPVNTVKPVLRIGTDATYPPMEFTNEQGVLAGYDIDLGNKVAEKMQSEVEFFEYSWDNIFSALENNQIDVIISSVSITDERKETYSFSTPYLNAGQVIITKKDNNLISSTDHLTDKKIAVQKGTTNESEALKYTSPELVIPYDDFIDATNALINSEVDAIFSDLTNAKGIVNDNPTLKIASEPFTKEEYGIVMRKSDNELLDQVNTALESLRQQGVLVYLKQKWLD